MKRPYPLNLVRSGAFAARILASSIATLLVSHPAQAQNTAINNNSLTGAIGTAGNWSPATVPTVAHDAVFTGTPGTGIRTFNSGTLTFGSLDVTATSGTYTIRNENLNAAASTLVLGGSGNLGNGVNGATASDLIYVNGGAKLKLLATGGTNGIGVFGLVLGQSGNFNIAGPSEISAVISDGGNHYAITKTGAGVLTLTGVNSYSGDTTVSDGTLVLAEQAGMKFVVTDDSSNRLGGTGTVTLNGVFSIDTVAVSNTSGWWTLVDVTALAESFGSTFSVVTTVDGVDEAWQKSSNVWTKNESGKTWTFTEATGVLALTGSGASAYDTWATTHPNNLSGTNAAFDFDYDHDGIANGLEWILGGAPTKNDTPSILPAVTGSAATGLTLVFKRASTSVAETTLVVEWGSDLGALANSQVIGTTDVPVDGNHPSVDIDAPATSQITVHIPAANAVGGKLFARLKATRND